MKIKNLKFSAFVFTVVALGSSSLFADITPPVGAGNLSPANGASGISIHPELIAKTVTGGAPPYLYRFELFAGSPCNVYPIQTSAPQVSTSWIPSNSLSYSTVYYWRNRAQDVQGNVSQYGPCWSFTTVPPPGSDTEPPSAPLDVRATPLSSTQIYLSWSASTDNVGVAGYKIFRASGPNPSNYVVIATTNWTNFTNSGLLPGTTYFYLVHAYDAAGNESGSSSSVVIQTPPSSGGGVIGGGSGTRKPVMTLSPESGY